VEDIPFPAITICGQGWIPEVVGRAINNQLHEYARSKGINISEVENDKRLKDNITRSYTSAWYPGATLSIHQIVKLLASQDPDVTLNSQILVNKGYDECENLVESHSEATGQVCPQHPKPWNSIEVDEKGVRKTLCLSVSEETMSTAMDPITGNLPSPGSVEPSANIMSGDSNTYFGDTCIGEGANRLRFEHGDSSLPDALFEEFCKYKTDCKKYF
jgi:hypothetical protein